jgi:hemoglobin
MDGVITEREPSRRCETEMSSASGGEGDMAWASANARVISAAKSDIALLDDIVRLVDTFYERVRADEVLGPIFDEVARTDWNQHLPKMYAFWQTVLFGVSGFRGNPLAVHRDLATKVPLGESEFERWLGLFYQSVDALFSGERAEEVKLRASRIAAVMQQHLGADERPCASSER